MIGVERASPDMADFDHGTPSPGAAASLADLFRDGKDPEALRTIGEVSEALGIRQHVLRYWEEQFPMLRPLTRAGGRRYYRPEDVALVAEIQRLLHEERFTIPGARSALAARKRKGGRADGGDADTPPLERLRKLRAKVARALEDDEAS